MHDTWQNINLHWRIQRHRSGPCSRSYRPRALRLWVLKQRKVTKHRLAAILSANWRAFLPWGPPSHHPLREKLFTFDVENMNNATAVWTALLPRHCQRLVLDCIEIDLFAIKYSLEWWILLEMRLTRFIKAVSFYISLIWCSIISLEHRFLSIFCPNFRQLLFANFNGNVREFQQQSMFQLPWKKILFT